MLVRQTLMYGLGNIIPGLVAVALVALFTRELSTDEYGLYVLVMTSIEFGWSLSLSWLTTAVVRLYPTQENKEKFLGAVLTIFLSTVALSLVVYVVLFVTLSEPRHQLLALLGLGLFVATGWMELNTGIFTARLEARRSVLTRISRSLGAGVFAASFVVAGAGAEGILAGATIGMVLPGLFQIFRDWCRVEEVGRIQNLTPLARIGAPLAGGIAVGSLGAYAGRFIVTAIEGVAALGLYAISAELAYRFVTAILGPLNMATAPLATHDLESQGLAAAQQRLSKACILMIGFMAPATVGITLVTPDIVEVLIGDEFKEVTLTLLPLVTVATMLLFFRTGYLDQALHLGMKQHFLFYREVVYLFVTVISSFYFVTYFGVIGLGYASVATTAIMIVVTYFFVRKAFPLPFPTMDIAKILAATAGMCAIVAVIPIEPGLVGLMVKSALGAALYIALVFVFDVSWARSTANDFFKARFAS